MNSPLELLSKYWNYENFRTPQEAIIRSALNEEDSLVLLPTGGGKSLCFQIPTLLMDGICIVVSPLIALINDQSTALKKKELKQLH